MPDNSRVLNRVFTRKVIIDLLKNGSNEVFDCVVRRYIDDPECKTHGEIISEIYSLLSKEKRNEYFYINTLLNKLLVGIHNVNTTTILSMIPDAQSVADIVMINGDGNVYVMEVKSELDNFDRLYNQISNYFLAFNKVSLLSSIHEIERAKQILSGFGNMGDAVGIYVLSDRGTIFNKKLSREPKQFSERLSHVCIFKLMRKNEYESVINDYYEKLPLVAPAFYFRACLDQFMKIPIDIAQSMTFNQLKKRNKIEKAAFEGIQRELKSVVYFSEISNMIPTLERFLHTRYRR